MPSVVGKNNVFNWKGEAECQMFVTEQARRGRITEEEKEEILATLQLGKE